MTSRAERNWEPVLNGEYYCSPSCGCSCKLSDYQAAHAKANALKDELGEGWKTVVWENCGWHFRAEKGVVEIHFDTYYKVYRAYFNTVKQQVTTGATPLEALTKASEAVEASIAKMSDDYLMIWPLGK